MDKYLKRKKIFVAPKPVESPPPADMAAASTSKKAKQEELEVTGVSRSGRVRKKSSKLTDFESPDEIDPRYKRKADRVPPTTVDTPEPATPKQRKTTAQPRKTPVVVQPPVVEETLSLGEEPSEDEEEEEEEGGYGGLKADSDSDSEAIVMFPHTEEVLEESSDESDGGTANSDDDDDDDDDDEGQLVMVDEGPKPSSRQPANQAMSLYMLEKSTKKRLVVKDGKIIGRKKAQRKDKGKSRFTAYMLWAKEARKEILRTNPDMDFSTTSKRLGELWGIVPNSEKYTWRRRAKRLSVKQKADEGKVATTSSPAQQRKFINKGTPPAPPPKLASPPRQEWKSQARRNSNQGQLSTLAAAAAVAQQQQLMQQQQLQSALAAAATDVKTGPKGSQDQAGMFKAVGTSPVDVAAHLKLLGESLLIIGERLKEHEGQIAVSGSFSVLLDSLLCAMAPLICLTQQVPELNGCAAETLSQTLDNIAYIMPGL